MEGPPRSTGRHWRRGQAQTGQAMVEFALVVGLFLLCLLSAMSASVYTVQRAAAVTAVAAGARVAAGGTSTAGGSNEANLSGAEPAVARVVTPVLVGTHIQQLPPARPCPEGRAIAPGTVYVCATQRTGAVSVRLRGRPASALPIPGLDWSLDLVAEVHTVTFAP